MSNLILEVKKMTALYHGDRLFKQLSLQWFDNEHLLVLGQERYQQALLEVLMSQWPVVSGSVEWANLTNIRSGVSPQIASVSSKHRFKNLSNQSEFYYQQRYNSGDAENTETTDQYLFGNEDSIGNNRKKELVQQFHLRPLLNKPLIQLSNGEMRRVLIAEAVRDVPDILLLDMPFTGLDPNARQTVHEILNDLASAGTRLLITGSLKDIPECITHIIEVDEQTAKKCSKDSYVKPHTPESLYRIFELPANKNSIEHTQYDSIVKMRNVNVCYGSIQVLTNVNWNVKQGERWALLGRNGAGKSTLLSLINGDNPQGYANDIILFDRKRGSGESIWDIKRKTGFLSPELHRYFPAGISCADAIESGFYDTVGLFRASNPAYHDICLKWLELLKIEHLISKRLESVSFAEQRLCLLARAMIKNPPLLLLDEPCQGLDDEQVERFKKIVDEICINSNTTLIYVTHYNDELPATVTKTLRLDKGIIIEKSG